MVVGNFGCGVEDGMGISKVLEAGGWNFEGSVRGRWAFRGSREGAWAEFRRLGEQVRGISQFPEAGWAGHGNGLTLANGAGILLLRVTVRR